MVVGLRVESENIQTSTIKHCNSSYFTMVAKDKAGNSAPVPGIILDTVESVRRFARSLHRQQENKIRKASFHPDEFKLDDHLDNLRDQNALVQLS